MNFSAVILAGGKSTRMGCDKAFLHVDGQYLLARQVQTANDAGAREVFISGRSEVDYSKFGCRVLHDGWLDSGPLAGIAIALAVATQPLLLVLAVDMPAVRPAFLCMLVSYCGQTTGAVPRVAGQIQPLVAVYPQSGLRLLQTWESRSDLEPRSGGLNRSIRSAKGFAARCVEAEVARYVDFAADAGGIFANCNTPRDLETCPPTSS